MWTKDAFATRAGRCTLGVVSLPICGEPTGYPAPVCTLPPGHPGAHESDVIPEELSGVVAETIRRHDELDRATERMEALSDRLRRRIRLNIRIAWLLLSVTAVNAVTMVYVWTR